MEYYLELWYDSLKKGKNDKLIEENQLLIMLGLEEKDLEKLSKNHKKVNKYMSEIKEVNKDPVFREYISEEEDKRKIYNTFKKNAEEAEVKAKEAVAEAQKAAQEAAQEAAKEAIEKKSVEIAKKLLEQNIDINIISNATGLSIKEIEDLK